MPKILRYRHRPECSNNQSQSQHYHVTAAMNSPRKVSFEDGHESSHSLRSSGSNSVTAVTAMMTSSSSSLTPAPLPTTTLRRSKSNLKRPRPSVCLVDLATRDANMEDSNNIQNNNSNSCLSPRLIASATETNTAPASPWGHFVDLLIPYEEEEVHHRRKNHEHQTSRDYASCRSSGYEPYPKLRRRESRRGCFLSSSATNTPLPTQIKPTAKLSPISKLAPKATAKLSPIAKLAPKAMTKPFWRKVSGDDEMTDDSLDGFLLRSPVAAAAAAAPPSGVTNNIVSNDSGGDDVENAFQKLHM